MRSFSSLARAAFALLFAALIIAPSMASAQLRRTAPASLTDAEFWEIFSTMSETGGSFPSENFISNEMTFLHPIPKLQGTVTKDGVYLGVGPEQNFTYIANLKPRMAIIFDIRRQNAMAHLMYKALFEMSPTRAEFVSRLFSRPAVARLGANVKVSDLFVSTSAALRSDSAYMANRRAIFNTIVDKHHFSLTPGDSAAIEHLVEVFFEAGPEVNYGYRPGRGGMGASYPDYGTIQNLTNADSVQMAFLSSEELYRSVRELHLRNLIVPVVGDFAGPKAIRAVGDYLRQRSMTVSAFYLSNVEQYLFQNGVAARFYENAAMLPIDSGSTFIRSVPPGGGGGFTVMNAVGTGGLVGGYSNSIVGQLGGGMIRRVAISDSNGSRIMRIVQDSGGYTITRTFRDSAGSMVLQTTESNAPPANSAVRDTSLDKRLKELAAQRDTAQAIITPANPVRALAPFAVSRQGSLAFSGGTLVSGMAPMKATLAEFAAGRVSAYRDIIAMTKIDGWK